MSYWSLNDLLMCIDDRASMNKKDLNQVLYQAKLHLERMDKELENLRPIAKGIRGLISEYNT